jgi:hypothetical protein
MAYDNLSRLLQTPGKCRSHFGDRHTNRDNYIIYNRQTMKMIAGSGDLQFNMAFETWWRPANFTFPKFYHWQR